MTQQEAWPALPWEEWKATCKTLHMWMQVVGKVKLELSPFLNEWWEVAFLLTARGMTTGTIPYGNGAFEVTFDFIDHDLCIATSDGRRRHIPLVPRSVAAFYQEFMGSLRALDISVTINTLPSEVPNPIRFELDQDNASYDPDYVNRWWRITLLTDGVLQRYRSSFVGKSSPIQFFWGSFDLNHARFSGRPAPRAAGMPRFFQIAEDQENVAAGFWPGNTGANGLTYGRAAFYSYIYPAPDGYAEATVRPEGAHYDSTLGEFVLPYDDVRRAADPAGAILEFLQSTYEAAADLAAWDRARLEQTPPRTPQRYS